MVKILQDMRLNIPDAYFFDRFLSEKLIKSLGWVKGMKKACNIHRDIVSMSICDLESAIHTQ